MKTAFEHGRPVQTAAADDYEPEAEQAIEEALREGERIGFKTAMMLFSATPKHDRDLSLTACALRHLTHPGAESITAAAHRLGVSRKTVYARIDKVKAMLPHLYKR